MRSPSLLARLVLAITVAELIVLFLVWPSVTILVTYLGLAATESNTVWAEFHAIEVIENALRKDSDGSVHIEATPALRAYQARNPNFRFAIIDERSGAALAGSSEELARVLPSGGAIISIKTYFRISNDPDPDARGVYMRMTTPNYSMVIHGYALHPEDLIAVMRAHTDIAQLVPFSPYVVFAIIGSWLATRFGLAPLYAAKERLAKIDLSSIDQRIDAAKAPKEIAPLLDAINAALARLEDGAKRQRRFTANAAHELLTPIAILRARLDAPNEPGFLSDLGRDMRRMQSVVEQLLVLARGAERGRLAVADLDLGALARHIIADYLPLIVDSGRSIALDPPAAPVIVRANGQALECMLSNLINNALRAEPLGGTIVLRVGPDARLEVIDHGEGVAASEQDLVFEPFWRRTETTRGAGLGLSIVKELAEKQGGGVYVTQTPGGGATFGLAFPSP
ncbi:MULTISPECIES: sensor histidine kinase [Methylosinus]|uniref:histidine kinase n=1 Tax=Methylosinus trichosporium (strain ATCC 35070 / NCIMB 11131 / UNIQEM 75 / OB3b) TaxID=595536 RepID=A0A2D2D3B2_METT3|nr:MULTISPECIES: HAMP domain-containing sensor histidine kinase [Methylosinus]ATQ69501.1 sensor histidine kinase [Methylosinus trichosporium OB3b]OBS51951.1 two-component sensor histidine kinase [Methylosinus sp. 3S-1]